MGIQNFPASLQPIIQQGFLEREFQQALRLALDTGRVPIGRRSRSESVRH